MIKSTGDSRREVNRFNLTFSGEIQAGQDPTLLIDAARRLVFLKGDDPHDYKFSSAVLEDYYHASPKWRERFLASSLLLLPGSADKDNSLVKRTRSALSA